MYPVKKLLRNFMIPRFYNTAEEFGLWPVDEDGNEKVSDDYDPYNQLDNLNLIVMTGGLIFVCVLLFSMFEGLLSG